MSATTDTQTKHVSAARRYVSVGEKIGYGLGDTASNFYWQMFVNFMAFFYTDVFGLTALALGNMMLVVRCWDTFIDPFMGIAADRTQTRWGHYRPYLLWGSVPLALIGVAMFYTPNMAPHGKLIYAYITYSLIMLAYTFINIPYGALMGVISPNSMERTQVSTWRFVLAYGGLFLVQGLTMPMVHFFGGGTALNNLRAGFPAAMGVFGVLAIILFAVTFSTTRERVQPAKQEAGTLKEDLSDLVRNVPWLMVCFIGVFAVFFITLRSSAILYYFKYYVMQQPGQMVQFLGHSYDSTTLGSLFMVFGTAGVIFGAGMASTFAKLLGGKRRAYIILMTSSSILTVLFYFIPREQIMMLFLCHLAISFLFAPTSPMLWAFYADTADYSEWRTGRRATGLVFSAASFSQKVGFAFGGALASWVLFFYGFAANQAQSAMVQNGIRYMMSFFPAAVGFLSAAFVVLYKLDDKRMVEIGEDLISRKAEIAAE